MNNFIKHFNKYSKWYSFGLLIIVTILVALLFIKVEQLDIFVSEQMNTPTSQHALTVQELEKKKAEETEKAATEETTGAEGESEGAGVME